MNRRLVLIRRTLLGIALFLALVLLGLDRYAAMVHRPSKTSTRVVIYTTKQCPYCEKLRRDLAASAIPYTEYDVEKTLQGQLGFWALSGRGVPVSVIGPTIVYGYRVQEIQEALKDLGYQYTPAASE
jgi:glutaredoxin